MATTDVTGAWKARLRRKAQQVECVPVASELDRASALHELGVHQLELELQNEELRRTEASLGATLSHWRQRHELAPVAYVTLDSHGKILEANRAAFELLGAEGEPSICEYLPSLMDQADADALYLHLRRALECREVQVGEFECKTARGQPLSLRVHTAVAPSDHDAAHLLCAVSELSERTDAASSIRELKQRTPQAMATLAGGVAHELNTPLQCMSDSLDFLEAAALRLLDLVDAYEDSLAAPFTTEAVRRARRRARPDYLRSELPRAATAGREKLQAAADVVTALRTTTHVDSPVPRAPISLNDAASHLAMLTKPAWEHVAVLSLELAEDMPAVVAEGRLVSQVIVALLTNAAQAVAARGHAPGGGRIVLRTGKDERMVTLEVEDNGCGVAADIADRLFEPFFTTREVGDGSGLGLALAYNVIVQQHGGSLTHYPGAGGGTILRLGLPLDPST